MSREIPIKLQDQVYVATIRRQDSDFVLETRPDYSLNNSAGNSSRNSFDRDRDRDRDYENISISKPERPRLDIRFSNADITNIHPVNTESFIPHQQQPEPGADDSRTDATAAGAMSGTISPRPRLTSRYPERNLWRIFSIFIFGATAGFSDATPGAVLPYIEEDYNLNYTTVSMIWIANAMGYVLVACSAHKIQVFLGKQKSLVAGSLCLLVMFATILSGTVFPVIVVAFFVGGLGLAAISAQANVFLARLEKLLKYLSLYHGCYGIGATVSPLIATTMVTNGVAWNYYYLVHLFMALVTATNMYLAWRDSDNDLAPWDHDEEHEQLISQTEQEEGIAMTDLNSPPKKSNGNPELIGAIKFKTTWILATFLFFYQGCEVALGGWIVTFLLDYRHGPLSVGYVASGFWGGLTLGRLCLTRPCHQYVGVRRSVIVCSVLSIVLVAIVWIVPNVIVGAVAVSLAGVFIGVNFPLMITLSVHLFPRRIQVVSLTIVTAFGSSGGAFIPFFVGLMSQSVGAFVVLPAFVVLYSVMLGLWIAVPNKERHLRGKETKTLLQKFW